MTVKILLIIWALNSFIYFPSNSLDDKTNEYLKTASWEKFYAKANYWQTPEKISQRSIYGKYPKDAMDFQIIRTIEKELQGVSRQAVLRKLFSEVNQPFMEEELK